MIGAVAGCFAVCLVALAIVVDIERRTSDKSLDPPSRDAWAVAWRRARTHIAESDDRPGLRDVPREFVTLLFGPAVAARVMIHVGGAVAIDGPPIDVDTRLRLASPVVGVGFMTDARLRVATFLFAAFWFLFGSRNMDPVGLWYFGAQIVFLASDPVFAAVHWVTEKNMGSSKTIGKTHGKI